MISGLGLTLLDYAECALADGTTSVLPVYEASVQWNGDDLGIAVMAAEGDPLIGMAMLRGFRIKIDVVPDGMVQVERMADA